jgi:hypothetical protein
MTDQDKANDGVIDFRLHGFAVTRRLVARDVSHPEDDRDATVADLAAAIKAMPSAQRTLLLIDVVEDSSALGQCREALSRAEGRVRELEAELQVWRDVGGEQRAATIAEVAADARRAQPLSKDSRRDEPSAPEVRAAPDTDDRVAPSGGDSGLLRDSQPLSSPVADDAAGGGSLPLPPKVSGAERAAYAVVWDKGYEAGWKDAARCGDMGSAPKYALNPYAAVKAAEEPTPPPAEEGKAERCPTCGCLYRCVRGCPGPSFVPASSVPDHPGGHGPTEALRREIVEALRECDPSCCGSLAKVADALESRAAKEER